MQECEFASITKSMGMQTSVPPFRAEGCQPSVCAPRNIIRAKGSLLQIAAF